MTDRTQTRGRAIEHTSVVDAMRAAVDDQPDGVFVDFAGTTFTFAQVWERSAALARGLRASGVGPGDPVLAMLDNNEDQLAAWIGTNMLGAIWVGVNTALRGEFLRHVVTDSDARVALCEPDLAERFLTLDGSLGSLELLLVRSSDGIGAADARMKVEVLDAFRHDGADQQWFDAAADAPSMLIYTGGTTGPSKGCTLSNGMVLNVARRYLECTGRTPDEVNWSPLPMYHLNIVAQTILSSVLLRSTAAIAPRFSVTDFWPEIQRSGATVVNLLGSMGSLIAQMDAVPAMERCVGQIRYVHGAPFSPAVQELWASRFGVGRMGGYYGMTEAVPLTLLRHDDQVPLDCQGRPNDRDFEIRIVDDDDCEVATGEVGEVVVRPRRRNVMFDRYWKQPEATLAATRGLWFHTGDLALIDEDGYFYFRDRKNDSLRRRGENISSLELEAAFVAHPAIEQVAVHAVPSELTEDEVKVTAVLVPGAALTAVELFEWAKDRVPYFALPRYIEFRERLPVSAVGRVHKFELRAEGVTLATWDRETAPGVTWQRR